MKGFLFTVVLIVASAISAVAQYYHTPFGHNRIQYKRFDWYYYSTNNFEVYYYPGGQEYALEALNFLEKEFVELTDILGYAPYTKTKIYVYNSLQDLQQSNIGIGGDVFTIGGKTDFVKLQVEIAYTGQASEFKKEMVEKLAQILIRDMMFGGSLAEIFQNSYLLSLPDWFIDGAAKYLARGWSSEMDDYIRDYLARKEINKLVKIQNEEAEIIGQSIWNYIAITYGRSNISNILNLTRIIRNEENSIASTLGITFKQFLHDWQNYYLRQKEEISQNYRSTNEEDLEAGYRNKEVVLKHVSLNADGNKVAYTFHKNGRYKVNVVDLETGKERTVVRGGYLINEQEIGYHLPLIDWQDNSTLGVILYKRGHLYLNTYNVNSGEKLQKPLNRFRQVQSFSFNDNGKLAIISGDVDGQNDLFLISMRRNALKRITNDLYDDIDPVFIPGTAAVVFSSNRTKDSVQLENKVELSSITENFNLFLYDLDTTTTRFRKLTNTYSTDIKPLPKNENYVYYLSDQKGIFNLYRYNLADSTFIQVSNFEYSISDYDLAFNGNDAITYMMLDNGRQKVFAEKNFPLNKSIFTPLTARERLEQAKYVANRLSKRKAMQEQEETAEPPAVNIEPKEPEELNGERLFSPDDYTFSDEENSAADTIRQVFEEPVENDGLIDTDNYKFEDEQDPSPSRSTGSSAFGRPESFFSKYRKLERETTIIGPQAYEPRFSFNNLITSFAIDPIRGFSILLETEINDMLENHRLTGGVLTDRSFRSGNVYATYQYLKYWMDFFVRFNRSTYLVEDIEEVYLKQKYTLNKVEAGAALPLTNTFRFELSSIFASTHFNNLQNQVVAGNPGPDFAEDNTVIYGGFRSAMVLDNTIEKGFNLYQGTRGLVEFEGYVSPGKSEQSFTRLNVDLRHYQKIHRELTLAGRVFYGRSMGNDPKRYLLGGMDNWLFNSKEDQGSGDPLDWSNTKDNSDILFTQFVTNLRGFDYNELYGTDALVFNAELRLPVFRYFSNAPISSTFLRNFQLIGFYDMGTAWTGKPPFSKDNAAFTKTYRPDGSSPFTAEIASFQNPWLAGYGFGLRTVLLGYYLKVDIARPIQDFEVGDTRYYFTLGLDF